LANHSPNHSYDRQDVAYSGKEPVVSKVEDLLKFTPDSLHLWRRRQKVVDQMEERSDNVEHVKEVDDVDVEADVDDDKEDDVDAGYDPENVEDADNDDDDDVVLQESANVPIIRNRQNQRRKTQNDKVDVSKTSNVDVKGKADSLELEEKNFPLKRRNDVSHAQYGKSTF